MHTAQNLGSYSKDSNYIDILDRQIHNSAPLQALGFENPNYSNIQAVPGFSRDKGGPFCLHGIKFPGIHGPMGSKKGTLKR